MLPPLINTVANVALETKLRAMVRLDPFWREQLAELNGLHLYIELIDCGFKRVIQFGPTDIHCLAPYTQAEVKLITRSRYLTLLRDEAQTQQAIDEGHIQLLGDEPAIQALLHFVRCHHADWETQLAQIMPDALAYQITTLGQMAMSQIQQAKQGLHDSYAFWRRNESTSH
jgi:ubiquinone biosynthesis protein UbiJ